MNSAKLQAHLAFCEARLSLLEKCIAEQMASPIATRRKRFLIFLGREKSMYTFALALLRDLAADDESQGLYTVLTSGGEQ
jgi:hypothetical protein